MKNTLIVLLLLFGIFPIASPQIRLRSESNLPRAGIEPEIIGADTYQWYEEGYRYPVIEIVETHRADSANPVLLSRSAYFLTSSVYKERVA